MNPSKTSKKIPGLLGLFVVVLGLGITIYLAQKTTNFFGRAAPSETPNTIRITNISDTSFTLTYQTDASYVGTMTMGADAQDIQVILDDRDQTSGTPKPYALHSITAKNLKPSTSYSFSILSGNTVFLNNGQKFLVTTARSLSASPSVQTPLAGKIRSLGTTPLNEVLVFATASNGQTLSTLIDPSGLYVLPVNTMRTKDLASYLSITNTTNFELLVTSPTETAHVTISALASNPVPDVLLGQSYDFTISANPIASSSAAGGFPAFSLDQKLKATPQILSPAKDNQGFTDAQPLFKGTALPNEDVTITIHSGEIITTKVTADTSGNWSFRPSSPLSPGQHTITISTTNASGIIQTIQKSFTVYAAGSQVDQSATPSATMTQATPTPTPKATPTPIQSGPTPRPSVSTGVQPSPTPTRKPTATPTLIPTVPTTKGGITESTPTPIKPRPTLPPTGSNATIVVGLTGIATTLVGMMVFFLTRGGGL